MIVFIGKSYKLDNGDLLISSYGKYEPDMLILVPKNHVQISKIVDEERYYVDIEVKENENIKFSANCVKIVPGTFGKTKKGADIFKIDINGPHLLIEVQWGGSFRTTDGRLESPIDETKIIKKIRKSSHGGGLGNTYYIFDRKYYESYTPNIDDF